MTTMFPAFLALESRRVVVVGGGSVAASKVDALLQAGANVTVVAPEVRPELERVGVEVVRRAFQDADLDGAWWVVAAAPSEVNRQVQAAAEARRVFVNAVDDPRHATAFLGGVVRRAGVTIAVSTDGRAPALAGLLREAIDAILPRDLDAWLQASDAARSVWREQGVPMAHRRPQLLEALNRLYEDRRSQLRRAKTGDVGAAMQGRVSLVGAGPGDPELWTMRAVRHLREADLVLYDSLVSAQELRHYTSAPCFCVGRRAGRGSVRQETIHRLMIRAARAGKRVVRLKGGDPFVFGRGGEEAVAMASAGISCEVVPGVSAALAAPLLAGIPVTHRGLASGFLVLSGHDADAFAQGIGATRPNAVSVVVLMGMGSRRDIARALVEQGWRADTPAAIICGASTRDEWIWTGSLSALGDAPAPSGVAGVLVVGDVVQVREALAPRGRAAAQERADGSSEVTYGRNR